MNEHSIASFLKQLRKTSGYSANQVVEMLNQYDIDISAKTLYGYESGLSMLNANVFVALCRIYKCDNPMDIFGNSSLKPDELSLIDKYSKLDTYGKEIVSTVLDKETQRIKKYGKLSESTPTVPTRIISYYFKNASAGTGQIVIDNLPEKDIEIPDKPEYRSVSYAIGVNGDSMEPVFHDGDILLVETTQEIHIGEIGIFQIDDMCYVKELGETSLISLNTDYPNIPLNESVRIQGKVIDKITM